VFSLIFSFLSITKTVYDLNIVPLVSGTVSPEAFQQFHNPGAVPLTELSVALSFAQLAKERSRP
jgi:hypothetical protein